MVCLYKFVQICSDQTCNLLTRVGKQTYLYLLDGGESSSFLESTMIGWSANFRSYLFSLPIRYEFVLPVSHWTRIHPSSPNSPITVPTLGSGPSCKQRAEWKSHLLLYANLFETMSRRKHSIPSHHIHPHPRGWGHSTWPMNRRDIALNCYRIELTRAYVSIS